MKLTEERISHLSHMILDQLLDEGTIFMTENHEPSIRAGVKKVFIGGLKKEEDLDDRIRSKIASYQRNIPVGSSEWELLYQRFYREEKVRKGDS